MKKLLFATLMLGSLNAYAFNLITDIRDNVTWTFGKQSEIGEAIKIVGAGDLKPGQTATSVLAGIADYRFLTLSYGGTRINQNDANFTDTAKVGIKLTSFLGWFTNPTTPEMAFLKNLNIGPSYAMSLFNSPHAGTLFMDINYSFGGTPAPVTTTP